jgi:hypothetical protein
MHRLKLAAFLFLAVAACARSPNIPDAMKPTIPNTEPECLARGGSWEARGLPFIGRPKNCELKTSDRGKSCTDSTQCEGSCIALLGQKDGAAATGSCSRNAPYSGPFPKVVQGTVRWPREVE